MTDDRAVRLALDAARLTAERAALAAEVARVEALADEWDAAGSANGRERFSIVVPVADLRAAPDGP